MILEELKIAIIGLGYVGLPLAVEFGKLRTTLGFDINKKRIKELKNKIDVTLETSSIELEKATNLSYTFDSKDLKDSNCYIITVPTPIDSNKKPNLQPLIDASVMVANLIDKGNIVIYESTVYPGATEEECVPILEKFSGLKYNKDFFCGYSPERINPGDKEHRLSSIRKITSGSTPEISDLIDDLYNQIIHVGTHKAESIRIAEAAKVIENTQRDINIALINELAMLFNKMGIDTKSVLDAAGSKWNFLHFTPGLVGGHCIGVDPYYLTHKAESIGYNPEIILAGRRINDNMAIYVASQLVKLMLKRSIKVDSANILVMGYTFKENCPDIRNTKILDMVHELSDFGAEVQVYDPWIDKSDVFKKYGIKSIQKLKENSYDAVIVAVAHDNFIEMGVSEIRKLCNKKGVLFDLKSIFPIEDSDIRL
jgi:UDP-N-acetyl-D-galactosamine dehydrogenase